MQKKIDIKHFALQKMIGKGAYGSVFLARKKDNDKIYAIKSIKKRKDAEQAKQQQHALTERDILSKAKHPFVVQLSYTFQNDNYFYFAMEYCPGGDLFGLLQKKKTLKEEQAQFYAVLVILALDYLHSEKIIYRDLKPENVLIDSNGYIKLADFGLSKILNDQEKAKSIAGTPEYLAPEILSKLGHDYKVDLWSLGCLIYEMLIGQPPFMCQDHPGHILELVKTSQPSYDYQLSHEVKDLIQGLLKKSPDERLSMEQVKQHSWFKGIDDWNAYKEMKKVPPYLPVISSQDENISDNFLEQGQFSSPSDGSGSQNLFPGFSGNNSNNSLM